MRITPHLSIGLIGGDGRTGRQFARLLRERGFRVETTGKRTEKKNRELFARCDVVIFSVPLEESERIMEREIVHATRRDQLVMDLSSLKTRQLEILGRAKGEVIGLHPLFAPTTDHRGQTVIVCPERAKRETLRSLLRLLKTMKLRTVVKTAQEHDRLMTFIQALPHLKSLLMADALRTMQADVREIAALCTPAYEIELNVIGRFLDDSASLYGPIILRNPGTLTLLRALRSRLDRYIRMAEEDDLPQFHRTYDSLREYFSPIRKHARKRSEACIRTLAALRVPRVL